MQASKWLSASAQEGCEMEEAWVTYGVKGGEATRYMKEEKETPRG